MKTVKSKASTMRKVKAAGAIAAIGAVVVVSQMRITRPVPGMARVETPRGVKFAKIDTQPGTLVNLLSGQPFWDPAIVFPNRSNAAVIWNIHETAPYRISYVTAEGQLVVRDIEPVEPIPTNP